MFSLLDLDLESKSVSWRNHLTMDTLVFDYTLAAIRPRWGLAPVRLYLCLANKRPEVCSFRPLFVFNASRLEGVITVVYESTSNSYDAVETFELT